MGCFSRCKIDDRTEVCDCDKYCFLIPKEFGGGYIEEQYQGYGRVGEYDWYELLAIWNCPKKCKFKDDIYLPLKPEDELTKYNRNLGIDIGCYAKDMIKLKYPLRVVSTNAKSFVYEDYDGKFSIDAPGQGWDESSVYAEELFHINHYLEEEKTNAN
ncbi:MAG: hypothetical protein RSC93_03205 [Erysipelotrichaceae bacterium]